MFGYLLKHLVFDISQERFNVHCVFVPYSWYDNHCIFLLSLPQELTLDTAGPGSMLDSVIYESQSVASWLPLVSSPESGK